MRGVERMVMVNISDTTVEKMHMVDNSLKVIQFWYSKKKQCSLQDNTKSTEIKER